MSASNIQVAIKVRPIDQKQTSKWEVAGNSIKLVDGGQPEPFYFDHIFDQDVSNQVIFDKIAKEIVTAGVKGFNGTIFAYGQTSSGKTYTMTGDDKNPGVMVLAAKKIFREIENSTDWQFLLRVSYIEIYNEKINDLLNKANTDLKIHETNGEVGVNCSEIIITCEQDLLVHLREGSKQRKIGETHMNERSSRSHAIFRIIIESRKIDQTDENSVQISSLNLVDLAGSERADQTGATGSRLKEGGHINKSLLFLSRVIKQLAEAKYVSYRDSKLTRILQASLGGNSLTAIICTINPTAVEETLSTLSFANRAKVVKNKPQVNEVVSDTTMMKRLVKKIDLLTTELEVEKTKNSQIKVGQLQKLLNDEIHKIINSNSLCSLKASSKNRRRTWCPSSMIPPLAEETSAKTETCIPKMTTASHQMPTKLQLPKSGFNFTPHITVRDVYYQEQLKEIECSPSIDEEFIPGEDACFDEAVTPKQSPLKMGFRTPTNSNLLRASLTPNPTDKENYQKLEQELIELQTFANLERDSFAFAKAEHLETQTKLANCQNRCQELDSKVKELEESSQASTNRIDRYEKEVTDLKDKINQLEMENRLAVGLEFEFQQHKNKSKRRETELLEALEEKRKEINKLERSLQTITTDMLNNSKEEIQQISRNLNESEPTCANCKDFQRVLSSKQQLIEDFEKINQTNQSLHLNIEKISAEVESEKLRADYLETENTALKKDIDSLTSLHGTLEDVQKQIVCLQSEKCKLESIKIEFEVMSQETAKKHVEKINISQEIQNLNTQRDSLAAECDKLQADIASTNCTREELDKIRIENDSLHSELQKIKIKLETAQQDHANLMNENQSKSESFEKLNMEVLSARNQLQTLQSEYYDIQQKYEEIQDECNKHEGTIGEIQSEYESIQTKYQRLQEEYQKLENDSVQSLTDCKWVRTQNENLETEIRELKNKVEDAQRKLLENDSLQLELNSLKSEMNRLQGEYQTNLATNISKKEEISLDLHKENANLKAKLNDLQERFDEMQKEYDDISTQLVDNFADYETLQTEKENLQAELHRYKVMKLKTEKLLAENSKLLKDNAEWENTVLSMSKSMGEKCDETEQLVAQLEEVKNESIRSESPQKKSSEECVQFIQLAESFLEIEIALGSGGSRIFQAVGCNKCSKGTRMIIGNVSEITQGTFNELRGAIEFAISTDMHKLSNDIFDSLEIEKNTASPNSCDSLEVPCEGKSSEDYVNELLEEQSQLEETVREFKKSVVTLRVGYDELVRARQELKDTQLIVEQLNCEKINLIAICEENKCKISELSEIISRAESENMKLIADCEELKKTVESEYALENISRESYEDLKRQHKEMSEKMLLSENLIAEDCITCADLRDQILALQAKFEDEAKENINKLDTTDSRCMSCEFVSRISHIEATLKEGVAVEKQTNGDHEKSQVPLQEEACKNVTMNGKLDESNHFVDEDKSAKYEQEICDLVEELKVEKCKYQEIESKITNLQKELEEKNKESAKHVEQLGELNLKFTKLQTEYDELLSFERMKSTELEESALRLEKLEKECNQLQKTVAGLKETVILLEGERNNILQEKKQLEKDNEELNERHKVLKDENMIVLDEKKMVLEKSLELEQEKENLAKECDSLKNSEMQLQEEKKMALEKSVELEQERENLVKECDSLKNSELLLQKEMQKVIVDYTIALKNKERQANESETRLRQELEQNAKEKHILEEKFNKLNVELTTVRADKLQLQTDLEKLKEQQEMLKESHLEERNFLQEKFNSLSKEIEELTCNKKQLESALEKAKCESERLLKQSIDLEEQLNQEICTVRNSNSSMEQQIVDLNEKLENTEKNLRVALEKSNSEKDQLIVDLNKKNDSLLGKNSELEAACNVLGKELDESKESLLSEISSKKELEKECRNKEELLSKTNQTNNSLETKCSELEDKCLVLEQQIAETKQTMSDDKERLEFLHKNCLEKDELITQLSNKNDSLTNKTADLELKISALEQQFEESKRCFLEDIRLKNEESSKKDVLITEISIENSSLATKTSNLEDKLSLLEKQVEEDKRCLATEIHLKEVLEKANTERDDLIVQLTNKNNSLVTKKTELEEKLAILGNQFEESTRHLSSEVGRLSKTLAETNATSTDQCAKIEDLMHKIKSLESDLQIAQDNASERISLLQKVDQLQSEYESLAVKNANLEQRRSSFEAELNSARAVVVENTALTEKVNELQGSLKEIQLKCDSLSSSNSQLELANKALAEQLKCAIQQAEECNQLRNVILELRDEVKKEQNLKNNSNDELKNHLKEWESKELLFNNQILQLKSNITALALEKKSIQTEFDAAVKCNAEKIAQLEQQIQSLQKDQSMNMSKSTISPRKEKGVDHWISENHQLKVKNMSLMEKLESSSHRSSPNEERKNRRLSTHDERRLHSFWDSNRDVSTMTDPTNAECSCLEMNLKLNELKQKLLIRDSQVNTLSMELKNHPLKTENATLKKLIVEEESKQQQLRQDIKKYKSLIVNRTNESKHCAKCEELSQKIFVDSCIQTNESVESESYRKLLSKYEDLKMICRGRYTKIRELEDALSKGKENANNDNILSQKYEHVEKELKIVQKKYEEAKILCNIRYEQIKRLENS